MGTNVVIGLDGRLVHSHDHDRLVPDFISGVVTGFGNLIEPRGGLPDTAPEPLVLQPAELRIDIATDTDAVWLGVPAWRPLCFAGHRLAWCPTIDSARCNAHK